MTENSNVCREGTVINTEGNTVFIRIEVVSACDACKAKSMCNLSEVEEKVIELNMAEPKKYKPGDKVSVFMKRSMGSKALWLGYLLPFLIVIISLFLFSYLSSSELQAGLISLLLLLPYYLTLYVLRNKLKKTFAFEIA